MFETLALSWSLSVMTRRRIEHILSGRATILPVTLQLVRNIASRQSLVHFRDGKFRGNPFVDPSPSLYTGSGCIFLQDTQPMFETYHICSKFNRQPKKEDTQVYSLIQRPGHEQNI